METRVLSTRVEIKTSGNRLFESLFQANGKEKSTSKQTPIMNSAAAVKRGKCKAPIIKSINALQVKVKPKLKHLFDFAKNVCCPFPNHLEMNEIANEVNSFS